MTPAEFENQWFDDHDYIVAHTSGSTGTPKTIRLLKNDMRASARATNQFFGLDSHATFVCPLSADYIAGKMMMVRAFECGTRATMLPPASQIRLPGRASLLAVVPAQVPATLQYAPLIDNLLIGGAPLSDDLKRDILNAGINAYESYGMTETCSHVALRKVGDKNFRAMPGVSFDVDSRNCLSIALPHYSLKALQTNDIVKLINNTEFVWLGRHDNVINTGGIKVHPEQLESQIAETVPRIPPFYITSIADPKWGRAVALVIEQTDNSNNNAQTLLATVNQALIAKGIDKRILPKTVITVKQLPRTPNGKLARHKYN